jgi:protein translocase SecG subunit
MKIFLIITQIIICLALILLILLQNSKGGLQSGIGGEAYSTKRGAEKIIFFSTIIVSILFLIISIANISVR